MSGKNSGAFAAHLKKQNIWFYICALLSVAIIALMFLPWVTEPHSASVLNLILDSFSHKDGIDLLIFLIPVTLGIIGVQIAYLISILRPEGEPVFAGTVSVLLAGIMMFLFVFATDIAYSAITVTDKVYTDSFTIFLGIDHWTWVPLIWLVLCIVQKRLTKLAHKKEVISYT